MRIIKLLDIFKKTETRQADMVRADTDLDRLLRKIEITSDTAMEIPAVSACTDFISDMVAVMPIKLYKENADGGIEDIKNDVRVGLLNDETGDLLDVYQLKRAVVRDFLIEGNGYIYPEMQGNRFISIRYIPHGSIGVSRKSVDPIYKSGEYVLGNGKILRDDEVIKILRGTKDGLTGTGIVEEHQQLLTAVYREIVYEKYLVETGGNKKGFLVSENRLEKEQLDHLKKTWHDLYANTGAAMMILNKGLTFHESSNTSVEMQLNENKVRNNELICELFGLSPSVISGNCNADEFANAVRRAVIPIVTAFEKALNRGLLLPSERKYYYYAFDTSELLRGDILKRYQAYQIGLQNSFLQIDDVRYREDLKPLDFDYIRLGLNDVLLDPKTKEIYTPNTDKTTSFGGGNAPKKLLDNNGDSGIIEERYKDDYLRNELGQFAGRKGSGSASSSGESSSGGKIKFGKKVDPKVRTAFNETFAEMEEKFGKITTISEVDVLSESEAGENYGLFSDHSGVLKLRYADKKNCLALHQQKVLEMKKAEKWSSSHPLHAFRHEIGHAIQLEHLKNDKQWDDKLKKINQIRQGILNIGENKVSKYAMISVDEFISECIAESMSKKSRSTANEVVKIVLGE